MLEQSNPFFPSPYKLLLLNSWVDQAIQFIEQVVLPEHAAKTKVHLVGNSVGGHLAVFLAALRPDLVESVCLLNATPVWGLNLPGWSGTLPAPAVPRAIGRYLFDRMRDLNTIRAFLDNSYSRKDAFDETLVRKTIFSSDFFLTQLVALTVVEFALDR